LWQHRRRIAAASPPHRRRIAAASPHRRIAARLFAWRFLLGSRRSSALCLFSGFQALLP
jgi:hypothetical protein